MPNMPLIQVRRAKPSRLPDVVRIVPKLERVLTAFNNHRVAWLPGLALALIVAPVLANTPAVQSDEALLPESRHEKIGELVTQFVEKSHYLHVSVNDDLSTAVMDRYIEALDRNRMYLLQSDIEYFDKYRYKLDDEVRSEPLDPVFDMFSIYRTRVRERFEYALSLLDAEPDLTVDEAYQFDRTEMPWAQTSAELDEIWRKRVKNDILNLTLTEKPWDETRDVLMKRYTRYLRRMDQITSDDVFETFMNAFAHTLDPHSSYLSPRNSEEYRIQMSLSYFGIGASLQTDEDFVNIVSIIPGGPASVDVETRRQDHWCRPGGRRSDGRRYWLAPGGCGRPDTRPFRYGRQAAHNSGRCAARRQRQGNQPDARPGETGRTGRKERHRQGAPGRP